MVNWWEAPLAEAGGHAVRLTVAWAAAAVSPATGRRGLARAAPCAVQAAAARRGLGRIVALYHRSSIPYHIY
jgi:hypothetical protein